MRRKPSRAACVERGVDARMGDAAEGDFGPAEAHAFPQHPRDFGDVGIGVGVVGAASDDDEQRLVAGVRRRRRDAVGGGVQQLRVDRQIAAKPHIDPRIVGDEAVHLPRQVVLDVAGREQHPGIAKMRLAPRAASAASPSRIVGRANSR